MLSAVMYASINPFDVVNVTLDAVISSIFMSPLDVEISTISNDLCGRYTTISAPAFLSCSTVTSSVSPFTATSTLIFSAFSFASADVAALAHFSTSIL